MSSKREERRQRSQEAKEARERQQQAARQRAVWLRVLAAGGVLGLLALGYAATQRERPTGRVWSAEHGHYHDR